MPSEEFNREVAAIHNRMDIGTPQATADLRRLHAGQKVLWSQEVRRRRLHDTDAALSRSVLKADNTNF